MQQKDAYSIINVGFIGYILVNKNTSFFGHWLFRDTVIQKSFSENIAEYIFQHEKNYTRQDLQYTAQEMKDSDTMRILATLQTSKSVFPSDRPDGQMKCPDTKQWFSLVTIRNARGSVPTPSNVSILSEQRSKHKPHGLGVCTAVRTTQQTRPTKSTCLHKCQDTNAMTANSGRVLLIIRMLASKLWRILLTVRMPNVLSRHLLWKSDFL